MSVLKLFFIYVVVVFALAVADFAFAICACKINGETIKSSKMSTGLYKKTSNIMCMLLFCGVDYVLAMLGGYDLKPTFSTLIFVYIASMEMISIAESYLKGDPQKRGFITEVVNSIFKKGGK